MNPNGMKCFAIKDTKAEGFNTPFFAPTFGIAERNFKDAAADEKNVVAKHAEDFSLWYIGTFDVKTGTIVPEINPQHVCNAT